MWSAARCTRMRTQLCTTLGNVHAQTIRSALDIIGYYSGTLRRRFRWAGSVSVSNDAFYTGTAYNSQYIPVLEHTRMYTRISYSYLYYYSQYYQCQVVLYVRHFVVVAPLLVKYERTHIEKRAVCPQPVLPDKYPNYLYRDRQSQQHRQQHRTHRRNNAAARLGRTRRYQAIGCGASSQSPLLTEASRTINTVFDVFTRRERRGLACPCCRPRGVCGDVLICGMCSGTAVSYHVTIIEQARVQHSSCSAAFCFGKPPAHNERQSARVLPSHSTWLKSRTMCTLECTGKIPGTDGVPLIAQGCGVLAVLFQPPGISTVDMLLYLRDCKNPTRSFFLQVVSKFSRLFFVTSIVLVFLSHMSIPLVAFP